MFSWKINILIENYYRLNHFQTNLFEQFGTFLTKMSRQTWIDDSMIVETTFCSKVLLSLLFERTIYSHNFSLCHCGNNDVLPRCANVLQGLLRLGYPFFVCVSRECKLQTNFNLYNKQFAKRIDFHGIFTSSCTCTCIVQAVLAKHISIKVKKQYFHKLTTIRFLFSGIRRERSNINFRVCCCFALRAQVVRGGKCNRKKRQR